MCTYVRIESRAVCNNKINLNSKNYKIKRNLINNMM